jgi:hypothetical protein
MANLAPATAWGLSRPVTPLFDFGCGSMLTRREVDASELAGLGVASGDSSRGREGCIDALLLAREDMDDCDARRGGGGLETGPGDPRRSRNESLWWVGLEGVGSGIGEAEAARLRGLRMGSLDDAGVREDTERTVFGVVLAYGLGVVRVSGLKLWPVSISAVLVDVFQRGRLLATEFGRGMPRFPVGVADPEPSRDGVPMVDILCDRGFLVT